MDTATVQLVRNVGTPWTLYGWLQLGLPAVAILVSVFVSVWLASRGWKRTLAATVEAKAHDELLIALNLERRPGNRSRLSQRWEKAPALCRPLSRKGCSSGIVERGS